MTAPVAPPVAPADHPATATWGARVPDPSGAAGRLLFVDNLRVLLTVLVVAHHAGQAYGPTSGRWLVFNPERAPILGAFFSVNAAFFMGLFFLVSAYFLPAAYDRKGARAFLADRFLRLGLPLVFFALVVFAPLIYATDYRAAGGEHRTGGS